MNTAGFNIKVLYYFTKPAIIFGISLGGFAAARFTAQYPERVAALILCSPAGATVPPDDLDEMLLGHLECPAGAGGNP